MVGLVLMLLGGPTLLYGVAGPFARAVGGLARRFGPAGHLAAESIERAPRRAWSTASAVMLAVGIVVSQNGLTRDAKASVTANLAPIGHTDFFVSTGLRANFSSALLFGHDVEDRIRALAGVGFVAGSQFSFATLGRERVMLQGVEDGVLDPSLTLLRPSARPAVLAGHAVAVSTQFADARHLHRGSVIALPTPTGIRHVPVVDIIESFKWDKGIVVMSLPALEQWFGRVGVGDLYVQVAPGADRTVVGRAIRAVTATLPFNVEVDTGPQFLKAVAASTDQVNATFAAMQWIIVGAALLAVLNALLIAVVERRRELGILRAIGTSRRMLRRMVKGEAGAVGLIAGGLGLAVGVVSHYAVLKSVGENTGYPMHYHFSFVPMIVAALSGAAVTVIGAAFPARRAATVNIIEAIGYE